MQGDLHGFFFSMLFPCIFKKHLSNKIEVFVFGKINHQLNIRFVINTSRISYQVNQNNFLNTNTKQHNVER